MKTIILLITLSLGILFPQGYVYSFLIKYFLMALLLFAFLDIQIEKSIIKRSHFYILAANLTLPFFLYLVLVPFNMQLAQSAFVTAAAPTAIAAPVIISILKRKVEYVAFSLVLTNFIIALLLPFVLPSITSNTHDINVWMILYPVLIVFAVPLALGLSLKYFFPSIHSWLSKFKDDSFYFLMGAIYLGTANASNYIRNNLDQSLVIVVLIGIISFLICFFNFSLGRYIGGNSFSIEAGQSLGQKNNAFTIWIALTFISPLAVLGPVFYVLFQNIFISYELYHHNRP
ncbi:MAG: hypothetical protein HXY50_08560 [Ignavibacteriaceae bacterium]|nr:hypothetical protein [Ignavibacteriaceae bacterium]